MKDRRLQNPFTYYTLWQDQTRRVIIFISVPISVYSLNGYCEIFARFRTVWR